MASLRTLPDAVRRRLAPALRRARRLAPSAREAAVILMYHRIASPPYDPWGLCVSPERFREQVAALLEHRTPLALDDLVEALESGAVPPRAVALTFDDGYADNVDAAKPILEAMRVPATMFLTTGLIGSGKQFWWDELATWVLGGRGAADFDFDVAGTRLRARWPSQNALPHDLAAWRYTDATSDERREAYLSLWRSLQRMEPGDRAAAMAELRERLFEETALGDRTDARPMTRAAARELASGVTSVGAHGRSHVPLPSLPLLARSDEIIGGRADVALLTGKGAPTGFAYPHGEWDAETRAMVVQAGFRWAVTTEAAKIDPRRYDPFSLPRLQAGNWQAADLLRALR